MIQVKQFSDQRIDDFILTTSNTEEFRELIKTIEREEKERKERLIAKEKVELNLNIYSNVSFR